MVTDDGGMAITRDHAKTFQVVTLPIGQMYHVAVDDQVPYWIYSNRQDDGTMRGPSNSPVPVTNVPSYAAAAGGCAAAASGAAEVAAAGAAARASRGRPGIGGCESGFTHPGARQPGRRLGVVLRQRGDALRQPDSAARGR